MHQLIAPTINLAILIAALVYYLRQPLRDWVHQRSVSLSEELVRVRDLLKDARAKHEEFHAKLGASSAEANALREQTRQDAAAARQRLLSDAQRLAGNIVTDARQAADGLYAELKGQLSSEMAGKVLERAERVLRERLTANDRARIRQEFSTQVESAK